MSDPKKLKAKIVLLAKAEDRFNVKPGDASNKATLASILRKGKGSWSAPWSAPWSATLISYPAQGKKEPTKDTKEVDFIDDAGRKFVFIVPKDFDAKRDLVIDIKDCGIKTSPDGKTTTVSVKPK